MDATMMRQMGKTAPTYMLVGKATNKGNMTLYQLLGLADGRLYNVNRETMLRAAGAGMVQNARVQEYNGVSILRGVGVNINDLRPIYPDRYMAARQRGRTVKEALYDARARLTAEEKAKKNAREANRQQRRNGGY